MGLATIDPHSRNVRTKLYKIPKFGVNRPNSKQETAIWKFQKLQRNVWPSGRHSVRMPYISLLILIFLNRCISVKTSLINTKLGNLVNVDQGGSCECGSIVANPIIYRIAPSPSRFETREWARTLSNTSSFAHKMPAEGPVLIKIFNNLWPMRGGERKRIPSA